MDLYNANERSMIARRFADEDGAIALAETTSILPAQAHALLSRVSSAALPHSVKIAEVAKRQDVSLGELFAAVGVGETLQHDAVITAELELKYAGYFVRERDQAAKLKRMGQFALDAGLPYSDMRSLTLEARQKLAAIRPSTLAQAARVPGVSPTDLQNLVIEIEKRRRSAADLSTR
jgi:tRNA uridine 5-carboxymethylaminomethyl modification enzyme